MQPNSYAAPSHQTYNSTNKGTNPLLFGVIGVLCVGLIILAVLLLGQKNGNENLENNNNNNNDNGIVTADTTSKVNFNGYTFSIPIDYITEEDFEYLMVYDDTQEWASNIGILDGVAYATVKNSTTQIQQNLESSGMTVKSVQEKTINGNSWVVIEYTKDGYNILGGYGELSSSKVITLEVLNTSNIYDTDKFNEFEKICSGAEISKNKGITTSTTNKGTLNEIAKTLK
jgi:hypothetical protein